MVKSNQPKRPTSNDVARLAGVSHTTVSFVINGVTTAGISEETRARVMDAIAQLDYHPHELARSLRKQSSQIIGIAFPEMFNEHYQQISKGVEEYLKRFGYHAFLCVTNFEQEEEERCLQWLKQQRFDALIISLSTGNALHDKVGQLCQQDYVVTGLGFAIENVSSARVEPASGERQLLEHLADLGHKRIGYIYGVASNDFDYRLNDCLSAQRALGIPVIDELIYRCAPGREDSYQATKALLHSHERSALPTALIVVNDLQATSVLTALHEEQIQIPEQISVASFDNTPMSNYTMPPLTTVSCDAQLIGEHAARLTLERLKDPQKPIEHIKVPARLVIRHSTAPSH